MTSVLLVDDHPLFRAALVSAVKQTRFGTNIVEAPGLISAQQALRSRDDFSLVLLDLRMPDCEGFAGLLALRAEFPAVAVAIVSASEDPGTVRRALSFGAAGFIPKSASLSMIVEALNAIMDGDVWAPHDAAQDADDVAGRIAALTPAQLRILIGLQKGRLNKQIAFDMGVTEATVKAHMTAIFRKLGVQNRTQAVLAAQALSEEVGAA